MLTRKFYETMNRDWPGKWALPVKDLPPDMLQGIGYPLFEKTIANLHEAFSKGQYGFTTWTFWPGATNSYLIEGIEQVWLNKITPDAYLDAGCRRCSARKPRKARCRRCRRGRPDATMWLFALPALLINVCIILIPAVLTFTAAFFMWDGVGKPAWAGLANFQNMFADPVFWSALTNNFIWTAIFLTVPVCHRAGDGGGAADGAERAHRRAVHHLPAAHSSRSRSPAASFRA